MSGVRTQLACLEDALKPKPHFAEPEHTPTYTLDRHIADARREMGPERWAELQKEWEQ